MHEHKKVSLVFLALSVVYILQVALTPATHTTLTRYHLTQGSVALVNLSVAIPYVIVWLIAFMGYIRLHAYASSIAHSKDGVAFLAVARGLLLLAFSWPLLSIMGNLTSRIYTLHPDMSARMVWLNNYFDVILLFIAFYFLQRSSQILAKLVKTVKLVLPSQIVTILYLGFTVFYVYLILHDPARHAPTKLVAVASYYQPDWLILLTVVVPRLIAWYLGIGAVQNLYRYRQSVKGSIYQLALKRLIQGLSGVIIFTIILLGAQSLTNQLSRLGLGVLLLIIYILIVFIATSYLFVYWGAENLQRIEDL